MKINDRIKKNLNTFLIEQTGKNSEERKARVNLEKILQQHHPFLCRFEMRVFKVESTQQNNFMMNIIDGSILGYLKFLHLNGENKLPHELKDIGIGRLESIETKNSQYRLEILMKLFELNNNEDPNIKDKSFLEGMITAVFESAQSKKEKQLLELANQNKIERLLNYIIGLEQKYLSINCNGRQSQLVDIMTSLQKLLNILIYIQGTIDTEDRSQQQDVSFKPSLNDNNKPIGFVIHLNQPLISIGVLNYNIVSPLNAFISQTKEGFQTALDQTQQISNSLLNPLDYEFIEKCESNSDSDVEIIEKQSFQNENSNIEVEVKPSKQIEEQPIQVIIDYTNMPKCKQCKIRNSNCFVAQLCSSCIYKYVCENM